MIEAMLLLSLIRSSLNKLGLFMMDMETAVMMVMKDMLGLVMMDMEVVNEAMIVKQFL